MNAQVFRTLIPDIAHTVQAPVRAISGPMRDASAAGESEEDDDDGDAAAEA